MDRRTAKREALWRAAGLIRSCLDAGYDFDEPYGDDAEKVERAMGEVLAELERRGHA